MSAGEVIRGCCDSSIDMSAAATCLTLLTDFGLQDSYVGVMKGAIAQIAPTLAVIDLTHAIPSQDIAAARFNLMSAYPYFPSGTVHVVVVDPGVGSSRRAIALSLSEGNPPGIIVAPDNGVISGVLSQQSEVAIASMRVVELTCRDYWRVAKPSRTFHGRDIFAPVGAHLASGVSLEQVGRNISVDSLVQFPIPPATIRTGQIDGTVQYIDRFGNGVTTIPAPSVLELRIQNRSSDRSSEIIQESERRLENSVANQYLKVRLHTPRGRYHLSYHTSYDQVPLGEGLALVGSHGWLEISVNQGSAAQMFHMNVGDPVEIRYLPTEDLG